MNTLSVNLVLEHRPCLVVGAGQIACRKIEKLLEAAAVVTVIAPVCCEAVRLLARSGDIRLFTRTYQPADIRGYVLVIAATDDPEVNETVFRNAESERILCNVVDDPPRCTFYFPAVSKKGLLQIAISSQGFLPFATKRFRRIIDDHIVSVNWDAWWQQACQLRDRVLSSCLQTDARDRLFDLFFARTLNVSGGIAVTPLDEETFDRILDSSQHMAGKDKTVNDQRECPGETDGTD